MGRPWGNPQGRVAKKRRQIHTKRSTAETEEQTTMSPLDAMRAQCSALNDWIQRACTLNISDNPALFDLSDKEDEARLIRLLWTGDYASSLTALSASCPELCALLSAATNNTYRPIAIRREIHAQHRLHMMEGVFSIMHRRRSQNHTSLVCVLLSLKANKCRVQHAFLESITTFFRGALMSFDWTEKFIPRAIALDPGTPFLTVPGLFLSAFDNLTIQVGYKAYATQETAGVSTNYRLDMTNWIIFDIDASIAPQLTDRTLHDIGAHTLSTPSF